MYYHVTAGSLPPSYAYILLFSSEPERTIQTRRRQQFTSLFFSLLFVQYYVRMRSSVSRVFLSRSPTRPTITKKNEILKKKTKKNK